MRWPDLRASDVASAQAGAFTVDLEVPYADFEGNIAATAIYHSTN